MGRHPDFQYRQAPVWRITSETDGAMEHGMVKYHLDLGIRHRRLIGESVETNLTLLDDFIATLLRVTLPRDLLHVEARSWLEDLGQLARREITDLSHEAGGGGREGFFFRCDTQPERVSCIVSALWPRSSEFSLGIPAAAPFRSPLQVRMPPDHSDALELIVSAQDETLLADLFVPAA